MKRQTRLTLAIVVLIVILVATGCYPARPPTRMTMVLLLRHAERDNGSLGEDGLERTDTLAHVALKAGVTAIYTTDTARTRQTVQPLADLLKLDPLIYQVGSPDQIREFATEVQKDHDGKVVLIVGHNPTVCQIDEALADRMLDDLLQDFQDGGICECINVGYRKLAHYVVSAVNPLGALQRRPG